jgi:hypothetical protein
MQASQLRPANELAKRYGVKTIIFGAPGSGKTPLIATAPRPVVLATEPGLASLRHTTVPVWEAYQPNKITEFMKWILESKEASAYDTVAVDSLSNVAELFLSHELDEKKHGLKAYGAANEKTLDICNALFHMQQKHVIMNAKQTTADNGRQSIMQNGVVVYEPILQKIPYFPGKELNTKVPHLFDNVMHLCEATIPGHAKPQKALRTQEIPEVRARDRYGNLNDLEPANLNYLFDKAMKGTV